MMKKRLLLSILVASMFITSAVSLSSCKKESNKTDSVPTVVSYVPVDRDHDYTHWYQCPYCPAVLYPLIAGTFDPDNLLEGEYHEHVFSPHPEPGELYVDKCLDGDLPGNYCPYAEEGRFHRHRIVYILSGPDGGIHNTWHVGGAGGSGN